MPEENNIGLYTTPDHQLVVKPLASPVPEPHEAVIHIKSTGICGSDIHLWKHWDLDKEMILGHESAGIVIEVGADVTKVKVGDRVAIEPGEPCAKMTCKECRDGRYNLCPRMQFKSAPTLDGLCCRYVKHDADWLYKLPDSMTFEQGALLEPLSVALAGVYRTPLQVGMPCLIGGAGPIGLVVLAVAKACGACPIVMYDIDDTRLEFAKTVASDVRTYKLDPKHSYQESASQLVQLFDGNEMPEVAFECSGVASSAGIASYTVTAGGTLMVIGMGAAMQTLPTRDMSFREVDLKFIFRYRDTWPKAIRLIENKLVNIDHLVTHRYKLEDAIDGFNKALDRSGENVIKIMIQD